MKSVFPFTVHAHHCGSYVINYKPFQKYVVAMAKHHDFAWYAYSVEFKNRTEAEVVVFGMADAYYGGIGKEIYRFEVGCPTAESNEAVIEEASRLAIEIRQKQIEDAEKEKIDAIKASIVSASFA